MELFEPRLMKLLTFITRHQAWLSHKEVAKSFRLDGRPVTSRTIHRWFVFLRENGSFVYYPYPKANVLGLQDVLVRIHGLKNPEILSLLPFGASFQVEVGMADGIPFVNQGYWVPGNAMEAFQDYWRTAQDLGLVTEVDLFQSRNTHFIYSQFESLTTPEGAASLHGPVDNRHFESLLKLHLKGQFEVKVGDVIVKSPLIVPIVLEHIWAHYSSRHVWQAIREKGEAPIKAYGRALARVYDRPGAALRLVQQQWAAVLRDFNTTFSQPRGFFDWTGLRNAMFLSFMIKPGAVDRMIEAAVRLSQKAIYTSFKPGVGYEERCLATCFAPSDQLVPLMEIVRECHRDREPPIMALQDQKGTFELFQKAFCRVDWRLFDPATLTWRFDGENYIERLKKMKAV